MPSTYFYADQMDADTVIRAILADQRLKVWEAEPNSASTYRLVREWADRRTARRAAAQFVLFNDAMGPVSVSEGLIDARDREAPPIQLIGWGLIHLQFSFTPLTELWESRLTCNSETRALKWADTDTAMGSPSVWDWRRVSSEYRRVAALLRKLAQDIVEGALVLPSIARRVHAGRARLNRQPALPSRPPA